MYIRPSRIKIIAIWFQPEVGTNGYYGVVLEDGTAVSLCTEEKWAIGRQFFSKKEWVNNAKVYQEPVEIVSDYTEKILRQSGIHEGTQWALTVPQEIVEGLKLRESRMAVL